MTDYKTRQQLDKIIELLEKLTVPDMNVTYTATYPTAPHELEPDITYYPWQRLETSSSL